MALSFIHSNARSSALLCGGGTETAQRDGGIRSAASIARLRLGAKWSKGLRNWEGLFILEALSVVSSLVTSPVHLFLPIFFPSLSPHTQAYTHTGTHTHTHTLHSLSSTNAVSAGQ